MKRSEVRVSGTQGEILERAGVQPQDGVLVISQKEALELLDRLSDLFVAEGLGAEDEPNDYGLRIEALIDRISRCCYKA
jgi:hypothetical protein